MKTLQAETDPAPKQRRSRFWLSRFALLLGLGALFYYGYCWGLWGRSSLLLQYLFQCGCPIASDEARYPKEVDVVVPACRYLGSTISPSGRLLYVEEETSESPSAYLLDFQTGEKTPFVLAEGSNHFLTDDLLFLFLEYGHGYGGGEYILDRTTGKQYPIRKFMYWRSDAYANGEKNLNVLVQDLQEANEVFLVVGLIFQEMIMMGWSNSCSKIILRITMSQICFLGRLYLQMEGSLRVRTGYT